MMVFSFFMKTLSWCILTGNNPWGTYPATWAATNPKKLVAHRKTQEIHGCLRSMGCCLVLLEPWIKVRPYGQKFSRTTWYNMVMRHKTCHDRGVWMVRATCVSCDILCCATMLCDQDCEPPNVGPLQKKFVQHYGLTKMCAIWRNLNIFLSFL